MTMWDKLKDFYYRLLALWGRLFFKQQKNKLLTTRKKRNMRKEKLHTGAHYYLGDLLGQMDQAFKAMKVLKKANAGTYKIFSKMACHVFSNDMEALFGNAYNIKTSDIPSYGCIFAPKESAFTDDKSDREMIEEDKVYPTFVFFQRIKNPINVQPSNDVILEVGVMLEFSNGPFASCFYVSVSPDGSIKPLRQLVQKQININPKRSRKGSRSFSVMRGQWEYSELLHAFCEGREKSFEEFVSDYVWVCINGSLSVDNGVNIRVGKGKDRITFAIDMLRSPYFFKDRDKAVNQNGKTKKIFHIVAAHERSLPDGNKKLVKSHFRGIRKFMWNGYKVNIILNGKHAKSMNSWSADAEDAVNENIPEGSITSYELADRVGKVLDTV